MILREEDKRGETDSGGKDATVLNHKHHNYDGKFGLATNVNGSNSIVDTLASKEAVSQSVVSPCV